MDSCTIVMIVMSRATSCIFGSRRNTALQSNVFPPPENYIPVESKEDTCGVLAGAYYYY